MEAAGGMSAEEQLLWVGGGLLVIHAALLRKGLASKNSGFAGERAEQRSTASASCVGFRRGAP